MPTEEGADDNAFGSIVQGEFRPATNAQEAQDVSAIEPTAARSYNATVAGPALLRRAEPSHED
jgi:hypothetical protein